MRFLALLLLLASLAGDSAGGDASSFVIGDVLSPRTGPTQPDRPVVRLLVTQFAYPNHHYPLIDRTISEFRSIFGAGNFEAMAFSGETSDINQADFVLSSAGTYLRMRSEGARDLATAVSSLAPNPNQAEGSLFVVLKQSANLQTFEDLKGKRVTITGLNAFSGYHIALGEIFKRGEDPDRFFGAVVTSGHDMRHELTLLRQGQADVAILRTCFLEELEASGHDISDLRPVAVRAAPHVDACISSTDRYPNWTLFATPRATPEQARIATTALLSMPTEKDGLHWSVASDFSSIDRLYRDLRLGPYEYLRVWTLELSFSEDDCTS